MLLILTQNLEINCQNTNFARILYIMSKLLRYILTLVLAVMCLTLQAQGTLRTDNRTAGNGISLGQGGNARGGSQKSTKNEDGTTTEEDDPCIDPPDDRYCWHFDPLTGNTYKAVPDTSYIGLSNINVMEAKAMAINYTSNLYSPHLVNQYFSRKEDKDFIFANAYQLFAVDPGEVIFYNTKIPFTVASYSHSGSSVNANDHLYIDFAGNIKPNIGIGTKLDYVYARGEYTSSSTKPLKWITYLYYNGDQYDANFSFNLSKYANQEWGGVLNRDHTLHPDLYNENFTQARSMPTQLNDAWNTTDFYNAHFTHSYNIGKWEERQEINEKDSLVWDEFIPVATIFHSIDFHSYSHWFRMGKNADQTDDGFFKNHYYNIDTTNDSTSYNNFSTYAGIRLNEGFNKWSQFGVSAFIGLEHQSYTNLVDELDLDYIEHEHTSTNVWLGGQLSRHLSSALTFDVTARTAISGDKLGDVDITGEIQTVIPFGRRDPETGHRKDSITLQARGFFRNTHPSYLTNHYFSNHFKWSEDFNPIQKFHIDGYAQLSRTMTSARVGIEHISNFIYYDSKDYKPHQYNEQLDIFSLEFRQGLKAGSWLYWENAILMQTSTDDNVLALPKFSFQTDLSLRFKIAKVLAMQVGATGYYNTKYYAPNYQPATQQFAVQHDIECGGYPILDLYINANLKRIKFFLLINNMLGQAVTNDTFNMPYYPQAPLRMEYGIAVDLQN